MAEVAGFRTWHLFGACGGGGQVARWLGAGTEVAVLLRPRRICGLVRKAGGGVAGFPRTVALCGETGPSARFGVNLRPCAERR